MGDHRGRGFRGRFWSRRGSFFGRGQGRGRGNRFDSPPQPSSITFGASKHSQGSSTLTSQRRVTDSYPAFPNPFRGWGLYFPEEGYSANSNTVNKVKAVQQYLRNSGIQQKIRKKDDINSEMACVVDVKAMVEDIEYIRRNWGKFLEDLKEEPEHTLACIGLAAHQLVSELELEEKKQIEENITTVDLPIIRARLINFEPIIQLRAIRASLFGKLVTVKGTIVRVGNIKPLCLWMAFECASCESVQSVRQQEGRYTQPTKCISHCCQAKQFIPKHQSHLTQTVNWQPVKLQEILNEDQGERGRIPRTLECELTEDLVDSCVPGDVVTITGIVKVANADDNKRSQDKCMFLLYLAIISVVNEKNRASGSEDSGDRTVGIGIEFTIKDYMAIRKIHDEKKLFRLLVASLCPTIYGHEMVKAGLLLALFGGTVKNSGDKNYIPVRSDPHVLVVGDPGLGKSQMLQACANIAPRGVYVCGNTTTTAGLTVTLCKEGGSGDYALEAGALVLADQGCCCIDEFDKMSTQHQALLEAMEQQSISVAKAGIVCSLPAHTAILAAANPVGGHYNKAKTVAENLKLGSALLSRFDLVFILLDRPDEEMDSKLSEHVMSLHAGQKKKSSQMKARALMSINISKISSDMSLSERLKFQPEEVVDPIPPQLLRKYIAYARKYVHSRLTKEAAKVLQGFYLELRSRHQTADSTPITTRQLESLIRLTEARAKLELREEALAEDAFDIVEIMKSSMVDTFSDEFGLLDFTRSQHGSGMSHKNQVKKFIAALQRQADRLCKNIFTVQEMRQLLQQLGIVVPDFFEFLTTLNNQGYLLKKGPKVYQLLTADY